MVGRYKVELGSILSPLNGQPSAPTVEMSVTAAFHPVSLQQLQYAGTAIALINRRIVQKAVLFPPPCGLQGRLKTYNLPIEHFFIVPLPLLVQEPAPGAAKGNITVQHAVVVEQ